MKTNFERVQVVAENWKPEQLLTWTFATHGEKVALATGMGVEGMVLTDMAWRINPAVQIFSGDTEFLFPETYDLMDRVEKKYGIKIERLYSELSPEQQAREHGPNLWAHDPDECCRIRKVEPLRKKLATLDAWVTAIRRGQTKERATVRKIEWDAKFNLVKISPIADWSREMVWDYVFKHNVPYNSLHDRNYPSIGCMHCTRAVQPGEDARAGRWSGLGKTECGLHTREPQRVELVQLASAAGDD